MTQGKGKSQIRERGGESALAQRLGGSDDSQIQI
jgi:hypothetical protein